MQHSSFTSTDPLALDITLKNTLPVWIFEQLSILHKSREQSFAKALVKACAQAPIRSAAFEGLCLFYLEQIDKAAFQDEASKKLFQIMVNTLQLTSFLAPNSVAPSDSHSEDKITTSGAAFSRVQNEPMAATSGNAFSATEEQHLSKAIEPISSSKDHSTPKGAPSSQKTHVTIVQFNAPIDSSAGGSLASRGVRLKGTIKSN